MERTVILSGFGGQGILFAGTVLARAAMAEGLEVFWIPSYGPEMRGGAAACTVILGDGPIGSPVVDRADVVIALSAPALERYGAKVATDGMLIVDGSTGTPARPVDGVEVLAPPCTQLATMAGDDRLVSIVALGALAARSTVIGADALRSGLRDVVGSKHPETLEADLRAFDSGMAAAAAAPGRSRGPAVLA